MIYLRKMESAMVLMLLLKVYSVSAPVSKIKSRLDWWKGGACDLTPGVHPMSNLLRKLFTNVEASFDLYASHYLNTMHDAGLLELELIGGQLSMDTDLNKDPVLVTKFVFALVKKNKVSITGTDATFVCIVSDVLNNIREVSKGMSMSIENACEIGARMRTMEHLELLFDWAATTSNEVRHKINDSKRALINAFFPELQACSNTNSNEELNTLLAHLRPIINDHFLFHFNSRLYTENRGLFPVHVWNKESLSACLPEDQTKCVCNVEDPEGPPFFRELVDWFLKQKYYLAEGVFRIPGSHVLVTYLMYSIMETPNVIKEKLENLDLDAKTTASAIKNFALEWFIDFEDYGDTHAVANPTEAFLKAVNRKSEGNLCIVAMWVKLVLIGRQVVDNVESNHMAEEATVTTVLNSALDITELWRKSQDNGAAVKARRNEFGVRLLREYDNQIALKLFRSAKFDQQRKKSKTGRWTMDKWTIFPMDDFSCDDV